MPTGEEAQGTAVPRYTVVPRVNCFLTYEDKVLLLKGAPTKRLWANLYNGIGGHMERGEDPYQAAVREIREESGLEVEELRLGGIVHVSLSTGPGVLMFLFTGPASSPEVHSSAEGTLEWVTREQLASLPVIEDLAVLLPRLLDVPAGAPPFFARSYYEAGQLKVEFSTRSAIDCL